MQSKEQVPVRNIMVRRSRSRCWSQREVKVQGDIGREGENAV